MTIYIVNLALIILLGNLLCIKGQKGKKAFMVLVALQLTLLVGLRAESVGRDTPAYLRLFFHNFEGVALNLDFFTSSNQEAGYRLFGWLMRQVSGQNFVYLTAVAAVPIILVCRGVYKHSFDPVLSMATFVALRPYAFLFTGMRQGIALGICFYAYRYIVEKKLFPFLACVLLAVTFHRSAVAFIPAYFLSRIHLNVKGFTIIALIGALILVARGPIAAVLAGVLEPAGHFAGYASRAFTGSGDAIMQGGLSITLVYLALLVFSQVRRHRIIEIDDNANALSVFTYFAFLFYLLGFMGSIFYRVAMYYAWFAILLLPLLSDSFKECKERLIFKYATYAVLSAQFIHFGPGFTLLPFKFFWQ